MNNVEKKNLQQSILGYNHIKPRVLYFPTFACKNHVFYASVSARAMYPMLLCLLSIKKLCIFVMTKNVNK